MWIILFSVTKTVALTNEALSKHGSVICKREKMSKKFNQLKKVAKKKLSR